MAKSRDAFRTISEVSATLDTPTHVLRFWESKFTQIKPVKRAGGRRYYRPDDIALLSGIKTLLHEQGMTIKGAQKLLREKGIKHVMALHQVEDTTENDVNIAPERIESEEQSENDSTVDLIDTKAADPEETQASEPAEPITTPTEPIAAEVPSEAVQPIPAASPAPVAATVAPRVSILPALTRQSANRLRASKTGIAPLVAQLEAVRDRMRAS